MPKPGFKVYRPTEEEILKRGSQVRWLREAEYPEEFVTSVMVYDLPDLDALYRLANRYGKQEAYERLKGFVEYNLIDRRRNDNED